MTGLMWLRRSPRLAIVVALVVMSVAGAVARATTGPADLTFTPRTEAEITNIDVLRAWISNYYGDPTKTGVFADDSNYAKEARSVAAAGWEWLAANAKSQDDSSKGKSQDDSPKATSGEHSSKAKSAEGSRKGRTREHSFTTNSYRPSSARKAIVLDVDDTTLATWNYEVFSNWAYNPTTNATYVTGQLFPAVPGMVDMVSKAAEKGYAVIYLTGRPATQEAPTLGNLTADKIGVDAGYPAPTTLNNGEDGLLTKPAVVDYPDYLKAACAVEIAAGKSCTTIHYKSATRSHIESLGYDIVASFGDQFSDFEGGYADKTFKLPNPNYYLP